MYKLKSLKNISFIYMSIYLDIAEIKYKKLHFFSKKGGGWRLDNYLYLYKGSPSGNVFAWKSKFQLSGPVP